MTDGTARGWGWVAHLRDGGTTPWRDWAAGGEAAGPVLPGAQQLELLRRINRAGVPSGDLVERVLATDPPRRSRPALPLEGGPRVPDHGPRPVDPGRIGDGELLRLAAVLLAADLAGHELRPPRRVLVRPWRIRYQLLGDPEYVGGLRRHLAARGRPEGGIGQVVVIGTDLGRMLVDVWTSQGLRHGGMSWPAWIDRRAGDPVLPASIELHRIAVAAEESPSARRVRVVTDPARAARLLGVRRGPEPPPTVAATAVDLGRRIVRAVRPMTPPTRRGRLVAEVLRPRLADEPGLPLVVPAQHREWLREQAARLHRELTRARYPVHGDPALVLPVERAGVERPDAAETLALAIRLLLSGTLRTESTKEGP